MIIVENPDTVKHIRALEQAIQRVRELASAIGLGEAMLYSKVIEAQILKVLDGE